MSEKSIPYTAAVAPLHRSVLPGAILICRAVSLGSVQGLQVLRFGGDVLRQHTPLQWLPGRLSAATLQECEAVVTDQLAMALIEHYGVQGELGEALGR